MPTLTAGEPNSIDNNNLQLPQIDTQTQPAAADTAATIEKPRRRKCPSKDTILISVPLHITADLGVAIRRTRKKREARIKRWLAEETAGEEQKPQIADDSAKQKDIQRDQNDGEELLGSDDDDDDNNEGPTISKEQYGSVLDYLEAKYVRGVSIAQYNSHGERVKRVTNNNNSQQSDKDDQDDEEEIMYDSDQDNNRSVYGDNDGFIDDSMLQEEVVDQVFASDSYGKTKIEMEAKRRRKEHLEGNDKDDDNDEKEEDFSEVESDFDDGFFVNIGDLEMEEGWKGDEDVIMSPVKRKPGRPKKSDSEQVDVVKPKAKKRKVDKDSIPSEKKKKKVDKSKNKVAGDGKTKIVKKKKTTSPAEKKLSPAKTTPKQAPKPKDEPQTPKSIMNNLAKQVKRKFNICTKQINELSPKHLPRKQRQKLTTKTSVSIPEGKGVGDTIMFENPHIPGQTLKVEIPAKADMENRTFCATVPIPKQPLPEPKGNDLPKELKDALYNYSNVYDEWVNAKGVHNSSLPEADRIDFKPHAEKAKKFDDLVTEFPTNLATPVDASYLRLIVRRIRNNMAKRVANKNKATVTNSSPTNASQEKAKPIIVKEEKKVMASVKLDAPQKGTVFAAVVLDRSNFTSSY